MSVRTIQKLIVIILIVILNFVIVSNCLKVYATELPNTKDQYMELKLVEVKDIEGSEKQLVFEWWSYNLSFKGLDLRFSYDLTKVQPSSVQDNSVVDSSNAISSFEFANDFASYMDYTVLTAEDGEYRCVMSLEEYDEAGTYIENDSTLGYVVNTNVTGGVLMGKMSFKLIDGAQIENTTFALQTGDTSPKTGIKIAQTSTTAYEDQSVFRFSVFVDDVKLNGIKYDFFNYIEENEQTVLPELVYEELDMDILDEDSTDDISKYTINMLENLDNISLKLDKVNEDSTVKINDEEIDVSNSKEIALNKLGEADTIIDILVTDADGTITHTYRLVIHKPYATIRGSITTSYTDSTTGKYICDIYAYNQNDVAKVFDWDTKITNFNTGITTDTINADLHSIQEVAKGTTNDDGTYEIKVMPGEYDILQDKPGYLDHIFIYLTVNEGDEIDLGIYDLIAGDVNKDGVVQIGDKNIVTVNNAKLSELEKEKERINELQNKDTLTEEEENELNNLKEEIKKEAEYKACDFNEDGVIQIGDKDIVTINNTKKREIVDCSYLKSEVDTGN